MPVYCVNYDLRKAGQNYEDLIAELKKYPGGSPLKSMWLIKTQQTTQQLFNAIGQHMDKNDGLLIVTATSPFAHAGLAPTWTKWLQDNL